MTMLTFDQLRSLAELSNAYKQLQAAQEAVGQAEEHCWQMGVSDRQVAAIGRKLHRSWRGVCHTSVMRRRQDRHAKILEVAG